MHFKKRSDDSTALLSQQPKRTIFSVWIVVELARIKNIKWSIRVAAFSCISVLQLCIEYTRTTPFSSINNVK